ncbi:N-acetylmuramoyl-L-alanine amidase [Mucilaginibacter aquatilis]|uniref:N-acetylmuramoyl-L-alanine amidase n=1 Tax=Mucilaginibacter aquatilis TaxID=1517760 RepID=A0A6I4IFB0_9SPHI|nr:N-acetylmuramoyl-L-alanine amidase [Mucilaginibacter aquatilis]MVN92059.1 N-acetylmuramoyl-L-alanine amidase [Mucilaginibacter aquatilis]
MNLKLYVYFFLALTIISSCKTKKPATIVNNSPKVYKTQIDSLLDIVKIKDTVRLADSAGTAIPSEFVATVNFNLRKPNYVIIHHTAQDSAKQTLNTFTLARTQVSAHYVVSRDGKVYHMLNDYLRSWHAGVSKWGSVTDMNSCSIGIELDNNGVQPFQDAQVKSLILLLAKLKKAYNIPTANFIGHSDIAPGRKTDPSAYFPWKTLAKSGFGYWSDDVLELAPETFDYVAALRIIGYDTSNLPAAIKAFKLHFIQNDVSSQLTQLDLNVLFNVAKKY